MTRPGFVWRMALRESRATGRRVLLLTAAIAVGVAALTAIGSFADNLRRAAETQARALLGADIAVSGTEPFAPRADSLIDRLAEGGSVARTTSFSAMAFVPRSGLTRLVQVRAVEPGYPFYGDPGTDPAGIWPRLQEGRFAIAEPAFLTALGAAPGDTVALGEARFVLLGVAANLPGTVSLRSAFGPRLWIPARFLGETRLLTFGSRATYTALVRLPMGIEAEDRVRPLRTEARSLQLRLRTARDNQEDLEETFDQLSRFLGLVALIALLLGGIGVGSAIQVFIRRKRETIAVLRCLGATGGEVFAIYLSQAVALGLLGSLAGVASGLAVQLALPHVFAPFLPLDVAVRPSPGAIALGLGVGLWVSLAFALLPLLGVRDVPPLAVLRQPFDEAPPRRAGWPTWTARVLVAASVAALAAIQVGNPVRGILFAAGLGAALLVLWLAALGLTRALRRWFPRRLPYVFRQGLANLYRPANQTVAVVLALGAGAFLLGSLSVVRHNLLARLALDLGPDRPNLVLFDIQPGQLDSLQALLAARGLPLEAPVPIVPMRILAINGRTSAEILADTAARRADRRISPWALRREYRSTYRDSLVASEKLVVGKLWEPGWTGAGAIPVSLETSIAGDLDVTVRDTIVWDVQGVPLTTVVTSLREVEWVRFEPNFYAVFPTGPLEQAPRSYVLLTRVEEGPEIGRIQRDVVERFPNVASLDVSSVQRTIERIVGSVVAAIRFMALFSLATGLVVLVGALATSRLQRLREAALLKTLGARRRDVIRVMVTEYAALGTLAALVAAGLAAAGGWALVRFVFDVPFALPWTAFGGLALVLVALTVGTGLWSSVEVFRRTPMEVLRAE
ncbi:MAG TPA: FtsX-like permease family protein [Gemmatimonadales bacterium]|jgi:putative ABC transport system permease protein|nr:FtsX-like permease family protein [Gemmatimonadales bacterium]